MGWGKIIYRYILEYIYTHIYTFLSFILIFNFIDLCGELHQKPLLEIKMT